jgi:hypothetical protein
MAADLPPVVIEERIQCSIAAALRYNIPANVMLAVAEQEGGRPGAVVPNTNDTVDYGSMQLNSAYIQSLARYGIRPEYVLAPGCYSYNLAAWRIRNHIRDDGGDLWTRVANYHSRTPSKNRPYRALIMAKGARWEAWLSSRYPTYSVNGVPVSGGRSAARSAEGPLVITASDVRGGGQFSAVAQPAIDAQPAGTSPTAGYVASILAATFNARITDTWRAMEANYGASNSFHKYGQAVDFVPRAGLNTITREQIRVVAAQHGIRVAELLGPGDKGHSNHWHLAFFTGDQTRPLDHAQIVLAREERGIGACPGIYLRGGELYRPGLFSSTREPRGCGTAERCADRGYGQLPPQHAAPDAR